MMIYDWETERRDHYPPRIPLLASIFLSLVLWAILALAVIGAVYISGRV